MTEYEQALTIIRSVLDENTDKQISEEKRETGYTYFINGPKPIRIFKLVKTTHKVNLEINVDLDMEPFKQLGTIDTIDRLTAHEKHLGTMLYRYRAQTSKELRPIIEALIHKI